jgi:uncharacterized protein YqgC (DUF456 family)
MIRHATGIALLIAGAAGLVLPVLPGIALIAAGVAVLGLDHPIVRKGKDWLDRRSWYRKRWGSEARK